MDTRTGEIVSESEMRRRLAGMSKPERRAEKKHWVRLDPVDAEALSKMTMAERIAYKVRSKLGGSNA